MTQATSRPQTDQVTATRRQLRQPPRYQVLMHNDDYTTMEFVVRILETVFRKSSSQAETIMMKIHLEGVGLCGVYPYEIAETKVARVHQLARQEGHPLRCSLQEDSP